MNKVLHLKAFTVVEVLIAMVVIVLALTASIMTTRSSFSADQDSMDYGLAKNLAEEGIEMVRNVIDTNVLKYSAYKDVCWNYWKQRDTNSICQVNPPTDDDTGRIIKSNYYTVYISPIDKSIVLRGDSAADSYLNETADSSKFILHKIKFIPPNPDTVFYANYNNMPGSDQGLYDIVRETKFYRSIKIEYPDLDDGAGGAPNGSPDMDKITAISKVWWQNRGRVSKFSVSETFYMSFE